MTLANLKALGRGPTQAQVETDERRGFALVHPQELRAAFARGKLPTAAPHARGRRAGKTIEPVKQHAFAKAAFEQQVDGLGSELLAGPYEKQATARDGLPKSRAQSGNGEMQARGGLDQDPRA